MVMANGSAIELIQNIVIESKVDSFIKDIDEALKIHAVNHRIEVDRSDENDIVVNVHATMRLPVDHIVVHFKLGACE